MNGATELVVMINISFLSSLPFSYQLNTIISNGFKILMYWSTIAIYTCTCRYLENNCATEKKLSF